MLEGRKEYLGRSAIVDGSNDNDIIMILHHWSYFDSDSSASCTDDIIDNGNDDDSDNNGQCNDNITNHENLYYYR